MSQEQTTEHVESFCASQTELKAIDDPIVTGALDGLRFSTTSHLTDLNVNYLEQCLTHWCIAQAPDCVLCGVKTAHEGYEWSSAGQLRFVWLCVGCTYEHDRTLRYKLPNPAGHEIYKGNPEPHKTLHALVQEGVTSVEEAVRVTRQETSEAHDEPVVTVAASLGGREDAA